MSLLYKMFFLLKVKFSNLFEKYMLLTDDFKFKINCWNFSKTFYNVKDLYKFKGFFAKVFGKISIAGFIPILKKYLVSLEFM